MKSLRWAWDEIWCISLIIFYFFTKPSRLNRQQFKKIRGEFSKSTLHYHLSSLTTTLTCIASHWLVNEAPKCIPMNCSSNSGERRISGGKFTPDPKGFALVRGSAWSVRLLASPNTTEGGCQFGNRRWLELIRASIFHTLHACIQTVVKYPNFVPNYSIDNYELRL